MYPPLPAVSNPAAASSGITTRDAGIAQQGPSFSSRLVSALRIHIHFRLAIAGVDALFTVVGLLDFISRLPPFRWLGTKTVAESILGGGSGASLEQHMQEMAKEFGVEIDESVWEG